MDLKSLSAEELYQKLDQKIDASALEQLKGKSDVARVYHVNAWMTLENKIDGEGLIEDLEEFSLVVPKAVSRLKLKQFVKKFAKPTNRYEVCVH